MSSCFFLFYFVVIELGRKIDYFYGAQVDSAQISMWSVLEGDAWCNQVTSLHEENQFIVQVEVENLIVADQCKNTSL